MACLAGRSTRAAVFRSVATSRPRGRGGGGIRGQPPDCTIKKKPGPQVEGRRSIPSRGTAVPIIFVLMKARTRQDSPIRGVTHKRFRQRRPVGSQGDPGEPVRQKESVPPGGRREEAGTAGSLRGELLVSSGTRPFPPPSRRRRNKPRESFRFGFLCRHQGLALRGLPPWLPSKRALLPEKAVFVPQ